ESSAQCPWSERDYVSGSGLGDRAVGARGADAVLPCPLRVIERAVGAFDEISRRHSGRRDGNTDTRGDSQPHQVWFVALVRFDALPNAFRDRARTLSGTTRHHHRELLSAESCAHVEDANRSPENLGDITNHHVACHMAESIVDALEAIEINHQQANRSQLANRSVEFFLQSRLEVSAVEESA